MAGTPDLESRTSSRRNFVGKLAGLVSGATVASYMLAPAGLFAQTKTTFSDY